jgi:cytochrome c oxidase subunit II
MRSAKLLPLALALIVVVSIAFFAMDWLPQLASANAKWTDSQLNLNLVLLGAVFLLVHGALAWLVWRHVDRRQVVLRTHPSRRTEIAWAALAAALFIGLNAAGSTLWAEHRFDGPAISTKPLVVEVTGVQFRWYFRYPGPDGVFGRVDPALVDASLGNPLGIDSNDPASKDDTVSAQLTLVRNLETELHIRAHDVIHSLFIPSMRIKQDAVPGSEEVIHFMPTESGTYDIACAELCGLGHHQMNAKVKVMDEVQR